ncbi:NAD(P)H-dependent flavin oxidoreductase [Paenibacillus sp. J5C2022]|uniref:NAD(P)H-dependent flavin oxidoreductase n=1 Tax=Paenibacillus sp. J5C2022 TaxID=2977129 RepID=UPI0021D1C5B1|nr:nitronate monooxygenase [Paenibacillus sp. J5C2022]
MWSESSICKLLGIQYPLIQAGMAGGATTPELVAAVSEAGGLGTLGAAYMKPEAIRSAVRRISELTKRPFAVNLFSVSMQDDWRRQREAERALNAVRERIGLKPGSEADGELRTLHTPDWFREQLTVVLEESVPVLSTAFGLLNEADREALQRRGVRFIAMATTVREALEAERRGADVIVAQGSDAGGHRGTFHLTDHPDGAQVGTFSLVPQVADAVQVPVVAAGGIMDGRGLAAAIMLGAQGVQMGTAFLTCRESGAHPAYQQAITASNEESTVITKVFSGRPARGIRNTFIDMMDESGHKPLPFPSQNTLTGEIRRHAAEMNEPEYMSLWAGQATRLSRSDRTAGELVHSVMKEAERLLKSRKQDA